MARPVNLCEVGRGWRLRAATGALALAILQVIVLTETAAPTAWWLTVAAPLAVMSLHVVQAYTAVSVVEARRGTRSVGGVSEPILDPRKRQMVQRRGRLVAVMAALLTVVTTAIVVLFASVR